MSDQLHHLLRMSVRSHVTLRVVPAALGAYTAMTGAFKLMEFAEFTPVAYHEGEIFTLFLEKREEIAAYRRILAALAGVALDEAESRELIAAVATELDADGEDQDDRAALAVPILGLADVPHHRHRLKHRSQGARLMGDDVRERQEMVGRIQARRASINAYLRKNRPRSHRLANISLVSSSVTIVLTAGPAAGGLTFVQAVQKALSLSESSIVWRVLCLGAVLVSLAAAISVNLYKSSDLTARIGAAESCNAGLEGLQELLEFGQLAVRDVLTIYSQLVTKIPFIEDDLAADARTR
ncbi:MAG: Scr1 family TA system antitoxin-like transcriptional regulator [Pseudonocardiaceae bacterium]